MNVVYICQCGLRTKIPKSLVVGMYNAVMSIQTPIPKEEIDLAKQLKNIKVVFDVGARTDIDYLELWPNAEHHLFEPNPEFVKELEPKVKGKLNIYVNNFGLGNLEEERGYQDSRQSFVESENLAPDSIFDRVLLIKTLDGYIQQHKIKQIDFLKIDTEGFDFKVLLGGENSCKITRFIQYEHWDNKEEFHLLLEKDFDMEYIGYRNVLCMNKELVPEGERQRLIKYIRDNKLGELV